MSRSRTVLLLLIGAAIARADDAFVGQVGGLIWLGHSKHIEMASEWVHIRLESGKSHYRAEFHFVNHGPAVTVRMGFPEDSNAPGEWPISEMKSWVDGKSVVVAPSKAKRIGPYHETFRRFWVKTVAFAAHGRRTVVVEYDAFNSEVPDGNLAEYILTTGSTWDGPIRDCMISIDWEDLTGEQEPSIDVPGAELDLRPNSPRYRVFHWKDLRPQADVDMSWEENFDNFYIDGKRFNLAMAGEYSRGYLTGDDGDPDLMCACLINLDPRSRFLGWSAWRHRAAKRPFVIRGRRVSFPTGKEIDVDGRVTALTKPLEAESYDPEDWDTPFVRLRDVVRALGWTWRYDKKLDRVFITTHPKRSH